MESSSLKVQLENGLQALNLELGGQQVDRLIGYLNLLSKWNKVYNLTAIRDPQEMLVKHLFDSLAVVPYIEQERLIDVGTGGGLPGIPLAICFPERQIDLLDSNHKKTRFLIQVKAELGLKSTQVFHSRVEEYRPEELYQAVISRAFASIDDMLFWTRHLLADKGVWWAMKAQKETDETLSLPADVTVSEIIELQVPQLDADRRLIKLIKQ
ncbi:MULTISPECIES: 16S rRNA (guanine(527)-N(7))-methyltransferase RsmG [Thiomicrorhabdus]|uniref:Ribosomal RNA small subunit methyltransferase G n=1 Tax=Thiomicrorhabdus heinhorstiae TaxID=2748010 RepID=A0ABS0BYB9_9GAMM|nr:MULTISPECIES: 16S rRNA (guanine(527)-N(7))-methyltransferase RsmG [Thiomicrorhabdus]MBF6058798.1 16S rRNA (guanine(527)-N(7))-methyltransferase RsmG [Thiomicrorhabdus heinhorstiae]